MNTSSATDMKWPFKRLVDLSASQQYSLVGGPFGSNLGSSNYIYDGVPVIRGVNLPDHSQFLFKDFVFVSEEKADQLLSNNAHPGDLVFTQRGTLGQVGLIPKNSPFKRFVISQSQMKLTVNETKADAYFLYCYFRLPGTVEAIKNLAMSSGIPHINLDILRKFEVPAPPLPIQQKIAAILSAYDDLIENNKRRIALLEKMAEEIYREWFVRMRFPGNEKMKFKKGLPEDWEKKRFGDFCLLKRGYDLPNSKIEPGEFPVVASTSIKTFHNQFKAKPPVITTGRSGSLGTVLLTLQNAWPLNTTLYVKNYFGNSPYFVYYTIKNMGLENFNAGAGVPTLNRNHINGIFIATPSKTLQKEFDTKLSAINKDKATIEKSIGVLNKSRDLLLNRLISGKLPVESLDIQFPPSMQTEQDAAHA